MQTRTLDVRPAADRFHTRFDWLDSHHSFSFGHHFDPDNVGHGLLIVSNDDVVAPGGGFGTHPHRDMEIVTWVLDGALEHRDSEGHEGVLYPGLAQRMSAGTGILHSEMNHSATEPVHFVQMWVVPDQTGITPGYEQRDVNDRLADGGLVPVASGRGHDGAIAIHQAGAAMHVGRLTDGEAAALPDAPFVHLFVARGSAMLADRPLTTGDAVRLVDAGPLEVAATDQAEVIVWESDSDGAAMSEIEVLTIVGSLRDDSWNHRLAHALAALAPGGMQLDIVRSDLPMYHGDVDHAEPPDPVSELRRRLEEADALLVVTPEYNHAMPGPLKNTLDWLSRPAFRSPLRDKPVTTVAATPGPGVPGRALGQVGSFFLAVAAAPLPWPGLAVGSVGEKLDGDTLADPRVARRAEAQLAALSDWIPAVAAYRRRDLDD